MAGTSVHDPERDQRILNRDMVNMLRGYADAIEAGTIAACSWGYSGPEHMEFDGGVGFHAYQRTSDPSFTIDLTLQYVEPEKTEAMQRHEHETR